MTRKKMAFTLIELLVVISIIALLIGILLPALGAARRTARQMQSNTQVRGIHQGAFIFSQSNNTKFPGLDGSTGKPSTYAGTDALGAALSDQVGRVLPSVAINGVTLGEGDEVDTRYGLLLNGNYFTGEYCISPVEQKTAWTSFMNGLTFDQNNYSFSMLNITANGGGTSTAAGDAVSGGNAATHRRSEWADTSNTSAVVITDRAVSISGGIRSIHTTTKDDWRGSVAYNDNHVNFETTSYMKNTKYTGGTSVSTDLLFAVTGGSGDGTDNGNAIMVYISDATTDSTQ